MFVRVAHVAALGAASLLLSTSAAAFQAPASPQERPRTAGPDKDERRCETIKLIGSRLAKKKFCGTRAEWEDKRLQDKQEVERIQRSPCVYSHNSGTGKPAC